MVAPALKNLKQRYHRHPRTGEQPRTAHTLRVLLNIVAVVPVHACCEPGEIQAYIPLADVAYVKGSDHEFIMSIGLAACLSTR